MSSARNLTLTLFGRFLRERGSWIAISHLVQLLEPLGIEPASTRTAVFRLKRDGLINADERSGLAGYALTPAGDAFFADGDLRIFQQPDGGEIKWVLATFSVPEAERNLRYRIRASLLDLGFGQLANGLLIAPAGRLDEAARRLTRENLDDRTRLWVAEHGPLGRLADVVSESWDLDLIRQRYEEVERIVGQATPEPRTDAEAFRHHVVAIDAWRSARYADPGLPHRVLGPTWPEPFARTAFSERDAELYPRSVAHLEATAPTLKRSVA